MNGEKKKKKTQHEHTGTKSGGLRHKIKYFAYSLFILIWHFKCISDSNEMETEGRINPWIGKLADDAEKLREPRAFFEED